MSCTPWHYFIVQQVAEEQKRFLCNSTGTVCFNLKRFKAAKVKVPPQELIDKFNKFCEPLFEIQRKNEEIIQKLQRLQKCWIESLE